MCLTADRQQLTDRAVRSFQAQSYENRWLLIFDTGVEPYIPGTRDPLIVIVRDLAMRGKRIGALRNEAAQLASRADIIAHWDSDDVSHPERLFLQFEDLLGNSATGFRNMLFFDSRPGKTNAWEYTYQMHGRVLGSSLMYWWKTWDQHHFDEAKIEGEESWWPSYVFGNSGCFPTNGVSPKPLLIADYHGANTGNYGAGSNGTPVFFDQTPAQHAAQKAAARWEFRRAPEWDEYCREVMVP